MIFTVTVGAGKERTGMRCTVTVGAGKERTGMRCTVTVGDGKERIIIITEHLPMSCMSSSSDHFLQRSMRTAAAGPVRNHGVHNFIA